MGFESFRVELRGGQATHRDADEVVRQFPGARPDSGSLPTKGSTDYLIGDGRQVIEVEVMDDPVKVSCRFTLCHPTSVDVAFLGVLRELMARPGMGAMICDDVPPAHARPFTLAEFSDFAVIVRNHIDVRRAEWVAAFGTETLAATMNEVHERMILPRCQPVVEQSI